MPRKTFFTVGYEHTTLDGLIAALEEHGVKRIIDTRDVANSRRAGFSKKGGVWKLSGFVAGD